jgi:nucleotide-binding universal stress UspA family protein
LPYLHSINRALPGTLQGGMGYRVSAYRLACGLQYALTGAIKMLNIQHILFPIDFSERCCNVVPFVVSMACRYSAKVTLLSVVPPFYYSAMGDPGTAVVVDFEELLEDLKARLDSSLTREFAGLHVDRVAELGDPAHMITEFAHTQDVDLIMMPTHGYGPFRSLLLGSVTAKVLHDAKCPVWTAAHLAQSGAKPPCRDQVACHDILCAVDGTPESAALMKWAGEFSKDAVATLRMVHVVPGMEGVISPQTDRTRKRKIRDEAGEMLARLEASAGVNAPICVDVGNVAETICEEARRHDANLVVIGRGVLHETFGRLRTHAHAIIRQSPCPVLSV